MRIKPFRALRPPAKWAASVASVPYDVGDLEDARKEAQANPMSFLHVERPEVDLPPDADLSTGIAHRVAADNLKRFQQQGWLIRDAAPALYLYRLARGEHRQRGLIAVCHADDYDRDTIRKHEKTKKPTEDERTLHISTVNANTGPVFLVYRDQVEIAIATEEAERGTPLYDFTAPDGVQHTIWLLPNAQRWLQQFSRVPVAYIADGHHRAAAAARVARERGGAPDAEHKWFLAVLFPASELQVLAYNRCVRDLHGLAPEAFLAKVRAVFGVSEAAPPRPNAPGRISMYLGGRWWGLTWTPDPRLDPVAAMDVSILQDRLLAPVLGIDDPRNSVRMEYVGGYASVEELIERVDSGRAAVGFSVYPTTVEQLMAISDAHQVMPPKSTWFEPKLRSGLFVHLLD